MLSFIFEEHFIDNYKPSWLIGLEIDRYYPSLRLAFEFQGDQHIKFSADKHINHDDFFHQMQRDRLKKEILQKKKIYLIEVDDIALLPDLFMDRVSFLLTNSNPIGFPSDLIDQIKKYQIGLQIYYKKLFKKIISESLFFPFFKIEKLDIAIDRYLIFPIDLSLREKRALCLLSIVSKQNEVLFHLDELYTYFPSFHLQELIISLTEKGILSVHELGLISIAETYQMRSMLFITKLINFVNLKNVEGSRST
jgi:hypothetical protein